MSSISILAYGSLIDDPGIELKPLVTRCIKPVQTPFSVEFARSSSTRNGAPTLVPVDVGGATVGGVLLVLDTTVDRAKAEDLLWRRETKNQCTGKPYPRTSNPGPNSVLIKCIYNFAGFETVLYTWIAPNIERLDPGRLAELAICSARRSAGAKRMDGISYLSSVIDAGISTPLSSKYEAAILEKTGVVNLNDAYCMIRSGAVRESAR